MVDREFAAARCRGAEAADHPPAVIDIDDHLAPPGERIGEADYESLLASGDPNFAGRWPSDEWQPIA